MSTSPYSSGEQLKQDTPRLAAMVVDGIHKGRSAEELKSILQSEGLDPDMADAVMSVAAQAAIAAHEIKKGSKTFDEALKEMNAPPEMSEMAEQTLRAISKVVEDHPFDTVASNPGGVVVQSIPFLKSNLTILLILGVPLFTIAICSALVGHYVWEAAYFIALCSAGLFFVLFNLLYKSTVTKFKYGCVNPAVVVQTDPCLIAVLGNLAHGGGPACNVIKIQSAYLSASNVSGYKVGARVPTVATYVDSGDPHRWGDFNPDAVQSVTTDSAVIAGVMKTLDEKTWNSVDEALKQIPDKSIIGLYPVTLAEDEKSETAQANS